MSISEKLIEYFSSHGWINHSDGYLTYNDSNTQIYIIYYMHNKHIHDAISTGSNNSVMCVYNNINAIPFFNSIGAYIFTEEEREDMLQCLNKESALYECLKHSVPILFLSRSDFTNNVNEHLS